MLIYNDVKKSITVIVCEDRATVNIERLNCFKDALGSFVVSFVEH